MDTTSRSSPREAQVNDIGYSDTITLEEWKGWGCVFPLPSIVNRIIQDMKLSENYIVPTWFLVHAGCLETWATSARSAGFLWKIVCVPKSNLARYGVASGFGCTCIQRIFYGRTIMGSCQGKYVVFKLQLCVFMEFSKMRKSCGIHFRMQEKTRFGMYTLVHVLLLPLHDSFSSVITILGSCQGKYVVFKLHLCVFMEFSKMRKSCGIHFRMQEKTRFGTFIQTII
ncbi:hypothetical protein CRYUN_Cryun06bG0091200 [Craigia yunnanensis]